MNQEKEIRVERKESDIKKMWPGSQVLIQPSIGKKQAYYDKHKFHISWCTQREE